MMVDGFVGGGFGGGGGYAGNRLVGAVIVVGGFDGGSCGEAGFVVDGSTVEGFMVDGANVDDIDGCVVGEIDDDVSGATSTRAEVGDKRPGKTVGGCGSNPESMTIGDTGRFTEAITAGDSGRGVECWLSSVRIGRIDSTTVIAELEVVA
jgi:hypothetical protein